MSLTARIKSLLSRAEKPEHLRRGELGERAAKKHLQKLGLKFLTATFRSERGEIDLIFREDDCLVFVEVKAVPPKTGRAPPLRWTRANDDYSPKPRSTTCAC